MALITRYRHGKRITSTTVVESTDVAFSSRGGNDPHPLNHCISLNTYEPDGTHVSHVVALSDAQVQELAAWAAKTRKNTVNGTKVRVAAVSGNVGSFGHRGVVLMAEDGRGWEVHWSVGVPGNLPPKEGTELVAAIDGDGNFVSQWAGVEVPRTLKPASAALIAQVWGK